MPNDTVYLYTKLTVAKVALGVNRTIVSPLPPAMIAKVPKVPPWVTTTDVPIPLGEAIVMSDQTTFVELDRKSVV